MNREYHIYSFEKLEVWKMGRAIKKEARNMKLHDCLSTTGFHKLNEQTPFSDGFCRRLSQMVCADGFLQTDVTIQRLQRLQRLQRFNGSTITTIQQFND